MQKLKVAGVVLVIGLVSLLAACGGGGGGTATTPVAAPVPPVILASAEGVYGGTLTGSASSNFQLLVLENGDFYAMYGVQTPSVFGVAGFIQGTGVSDNGKFTSSGSKDFGYTPAVAVTTSASYDPTNKTITGTVVTGDRVTGVNGGPIANTTYNYNTAASLASITGSWFTTSVTGELVNLSVASTGAFTASGSSGCQFSGTLVPRPSGKNVFNVVFTFGSFPCALAGQSASGIALVYPITGGRTQLVVAGVNGARTNGAAVFGTR